jgi:hypothetical protein
MYKRITCGGLKLFWLAKTRSGPVWIACFGAGDFETMIGLVG